jgi:uncharacterized protein (TIGR00730 family)
MSRPSTHLCVFCGSHAGHSPEYAEAARALGRALVLRGIGLVYGAGSGGLMGVLADTVLAGGGCAVGVIPTFLATAELMHRGLTETHVVGTMHARKALMAELSDAFVALPGGYGTMEEVLEAITWQQLRIHEKPVGLLDVGGFFRPLVSQLDHCEKEGFLASAERRRLVVDADPDRLLARLGLLPTG